MSDYSMQTTDQRETCEWLAYLTGKGHYSAVSCIKKYIADLEQRIETAEMALVRDSIAT